MPTAWIPGVGNTQIPAGSESSLPPGSKIVPAGPTAPAGSLPSLPTPSPAPNYNIPYPSGGGGGNSQTPTGGSVVNQNPMPQQQPIGTVPPQQVQPQNPAVLPNMTNDLYDRFMELFRQNEATLAQQRAAAEQQAARQFEEQKRAFESLTNSLKSGQQFELDAINNQTKVIQQQLEDRTFQNWLQTRQGVANRGLAGSGIASDADTRLLLDKQRSLADLGNTQTSNAAEINRRYSNQLNDVYGKMSGLNQSEMAQQIFKQLYESTNSGLIEQGKLFADLIGKTIGYDKMKPNDWLEYQDKQGQRQSDDYFKFVDKFGFDPYNPSVQSIEMLKVNNEARKQTMDFLGYDPVTGATTLTAIRDKNKYALDISEKLGYLVDTNGQLVVDGAGNPIQLLEREKYNETVRNNSLQSQFNYDKLTAQVQQWTESNILRGNEILLDREALKHKIDHDNTMIGLAKDAAKDDATRTKLDGLKARLHSLGDQLQAKQKSLSPGKTLAPNDAVVAEWNATMQAINILIDPPKARQANTGQVGQMLQQNGVMTPKLP